MTRSGAAAMLPPMQIKLMGGMRKAGSFALGLKTTLITLIGGIDLDLTRAEVPDGARVTKVSLVGGVSLTVPPGVGVDAGGFSVFGGHSSRPAGPGQPTVSVRCYGLAGGVKVRVAGGA
jgi:hypothetical protein